VAVPQIGHGAQSIEQVTAAVFGGLGLGITPGRVVLMVINL
jgi:hypothetical protein